MDAPVEPIQKPFGYVCFYGGRRWECHADTQFDAKLQAIAHFKPRKGEKHMVQAILAEKHGQPVFQSTLLG